MMAVMATLGGFPVLTRSSYFALRFGLKRQATRAGIEVDFSLPAERVIRSLNQIIE